jgi:hypothetical protein
MEMVKIGHDDSFALKAHFLPKNINAYPLAVIWSELFFLRKEAIVLL